MSQAVVDKFQGMYNNIARWEEIAEIVTSVMVFSVLFLIAHEIFIFFTPYEASTLRWIFLNTAIFSIILDFACYAKVTKLNEELDMYIEFCRKEYRDQLDKFVEILN